MPVTIRSTIQAGPGGTIGLPTGYDSANDIVLYWVGSDIVSSTPSGLTELLSGTFAGWTHKLYIGTGAVTGPLSFAPGGYTDMFGLALQGVDRSSAVSGTPTNNQGTGTTATGLSIDVARNGSMLFLGSISSVGARSGGPAGMSPATGSPYDTNMYVDFQAVDAGATGNKTSTYGSESWIMQMIALQPVAGEVVVTPVQSPPLFFFFDA